MSWTLLAIGDGRDDYHNRSLTSARAALPEPNDIVVVDDSDHELGFAGAIQHGWDRIRTEWVFHLELDFLFERPVPLERMIALLDRKPTLAQLVLKRQPWNESERDAGGIVEQHPDDFTQRTDRGDTWTEHRRFWSTNPSVYSAGWCAQGWPQAPESEGKWTARLREDPELRFAFWGAKLDPPVVTHIGESRAGVGY